MLWVHGTAPRLATPLHVCVGFPGDTPPPSSEAGQPLGASAGQTNWKRPPSLGRVNPGPPATTQSPSIIAAPSQLFLPNKTQTRELRGTSQNTGESHRGPPTTIHRFCPICESKVRAGGPLPATSALISGPESSSYLAVCPQQALTENSKVLDSKTSVLPDTVLSNQDNTVLPANSVQTMAANGTALLDCRPSSSAEVNWAGGGSSPACPSLPL